MNKALPPTYVCEDVEIEVEDREGEEHGGGGIVDPIRLLQGLEDVANEGLNKGKGFYAIRVYIQEEDTDTDTDTETRVCCVACVLCNVCCVACVCQCTVIWRDEVCVHAGACPNKQT